MKHQMKAYVLFLVLLMLLASGCVGPGTATYSPQQAGGGKLRVVATTTIVGDVVRAVGDDAIELTVLLPPNADPHTYEPTPQDIARVTEADVIFLNGAGLETALLRLIEGVGNRVPVVAVSEGIKFRTFEEKGSDVDPHVWFDPTNVITWTRNIERTLSELDPANAEVYRANARSYEGALRELDAWIEEQVSEIPSQRRKLVTDHLAFGYFADRYGFEQVGAIFPGFSAEAEPSAGEVAELEDKIRRLGVPAIFVGTTVNPALARRIARDTGVKVVPLYTGSLSGPDGPAPSYIEFMRYDVNAIVQALGGE